VMINLINNAIKFTRKGKIEFGYLVKKEKIRIYVKDTGIGIAPENHELIFMRFRQVNASASREQGGTGLGLAISKALVEKMGGVILVDSSLGNGSTFWIDIPFREVEAGAINSTIEGMEPEITYNWSGKVVLIAEDEDANYTLLRIYLKNTECRIVRASNGQEAIDMTMQLKPDLVLMDMKMPVMGGFEATRQIKKSFPEIPVIAQTAYALSDDRPKAIAAGCDHYISKPISKKILLNALSRYLAD
jgi:CheY-like chemotaxis protein